MAACGGACRWNLSPALVDSGHASGKSPRMVEPDILESPEGERSARRKPESLSRLKASARKLFVERGYHATRPQDIAREAGLGHGTFYLHFPDKRPCFPPFLDA